MQPAKLDVISPTLFIMIVATAFIRNDLWLLGFGVVVLTVITIAYLSLARRAASRPSAPADTGVQETGPIRIKKWTLKDSDRISIEYTKDLQRGKITRD
jgi:hypothetical protein